MDVIFENKRIISRTPMAIHLKKIIVVHEKNVTVSRQEKECMLCIGLRFDLRLLELYFIFIVYKKKAP